MSKTGKEVPSSSKASAGSPTSMYSELATRMSVLDSLAKMSLDWKPASSKVEPDTISCKTSVLLETSTNSTPLTPTKALQRYYSILSRFELHEIHDYQDIYFLGRDHQRKLLPRSNYGHDCRLGFYRYVAGDHIGYRYEVLEQLGKVSYAEVFKVYDHKESIIVVLKIGRSLPPYSFQVKREIQLLKRLKESNVKINMIQMMDHFCFRNHECVTFKLLPFDLIHLIKLSKGEGYHLHFVQKWILSLVTTSVEVGKQKIVHGDLKPGNLLLEGLDSTEVMLIDFGFASYDGQDLLPNVQALRYRAPEVLLGATKYGPPIDMWSVGVIAAELYSGDNLFTSNSETEQVAALVELLGSPPEELLKVSDPKMKSVVDSLLRKAGEAESKTFYRGTSGPRELRGALKYCNGNLFLDFIRKCLDWNPDGRLKPDEALCHPWIIKGIQKPIYDCGKTFVESLERGGSNTSGVFLYENKPGKPDGKKWCIRGLEDMTLNVNDERKDQP